MARFSVSDKYAGKKGPCPKCKKEIIVPDKSLEVVIHAPETSGPKNSKGVAVLKPIKRKEFRVGWKTLLGATVGALSVIGIAIAVRLSNAPPPAWLLIVGAIAIAPPIVMLAYTFLRNDELEGYTGKEYFIRTAICSLVFSLTWLLYYTMAIYLDNKSLAEVPVAQMAILMVGMIAIGTGASIATLELETGQAVMHYATYFAASFFLCLIMGIELAEPLAKPKPKSKPAISQPRQLPMQPSATQKQTTPPAQTPAVPSKAPPANPANTKPPTKAAPK